MENSSPRHGDGGAAGGSPIDEYIEPEEPLRRWPSHQWVTTTCWWRSLVLPMMPTNPEELHYPMMIWRWQAAVVQLLWMDGRRLCPAGFHGVVDEDAGTCRWAHNGFHLLLFETAPWSQKKKRPLMLQLLTLKDMSPMKLPQLKILRGLNMDMMDTPDQSWWCQRCLLLKLRNHVMNLDVEKPPTTTWSNWLKDFGSWRTSSMAQSRIPAPAVDPRQTGWPCSGRHVSSRERSNQYGRWTACLKCGLRLTYEVKVKGHGESRTLGTAPGQRDERKDLPRESYGDQGQAVGDESWAGQHQDRGQSGRSSWAASLLNATEGTGTTSRRSTTPTRSTTAPTSRRRPTTPTPVPATPRRETRSISPTPSLAPSTASVAAAKAKAKMAPRTPVAEREISEPLSPEIMEIHSDGSAEVVGDSRASGLPWWPCARRWAPMEPIPRVPMWTLVAHGWKPTATTARQPSLYGNNFDNIQDTSTTSTTASEPTKDILSVKNCFTKEILPPLAKKLAKAATLSAIVLGPVTDAFKAAESQLDLMEVARSPTSTLTASRRMDWAASASTTSLGMTWTPIAGPRHWLRTSWPRSLASLGFLCRAPDFLHYKISPNEMQKLGAALWNVEDKIYGEPRRCQRPWNQSWKLMTSDGNGPLVLWLDGVLMLSNALRRWPNDMAGRSTGWRSMDASVWAEVERPSPSKGMDDPDHLEGALSSSSQTMPWRSCSCWMPRWCCKGLILLGGSGWLVSTYPI